MAEWVTGVDLRVDLLSQEGAPPIIIPASLLANYPFYPNAPSSFPSFPFPSMVHLSLHSSKGSPLILSIFLTTQPNYSTGNQGVRYFPYSGYLGLTPLKVEGGASITS